MCYMHRHLTSPCLTFFATFNASLIDEVRNEVEAETDADAVAAPRPKAWDTCVYIIITHHKHEHGHWHRVRSGTGTGTVFGTELKQDAHAVSGH